MTRRLGGILALCAITGGLMYADVGYASSVRGPRTGTLVGSVLACSSSKRCSSVAATVSVHAVSDGRVGRVVAKQYASSGRFSFTLGGGTYEPQASGVHARLNGGPCSSAVALVRRGKTTVENVRCSVK